MRHKEVLARTSTQDIHLLADSPQQSPWLKVWALGAALVVTAALLGGYYLLHRRQQQQALAARAAAQSARMSQPPAAQIFEDEARLAGANAVIGGKVRNDSNERLTGLRVELQLIPREGDKLEVREVKLEPGDLPPGAEGRYQLTVPSHQWSGSRIVRLFSAGQRGDITFMATLGERRPLERTPQGVTKVLVVPAKRGQGEEFINTPDNPIPIR